MPKKSFLIKCLFFLLSVFSRELNGQIDSTCYFFTGANITLMNFFQSEDFFKGWTTTSENKSIKAFEAGILFRFGSDNKNWSGLKLQISSSASDALSRSKFVSFIEQKRTISYTSTDNLGIKMTNISYVFLRAFRSDKRTGFFINPAIILATMKQNFIRDFSAESEAKATGFNLESGVVWYPIKEIGIKTLFGYRSLKIKINAFESTGELINWSGPYLAAGISIAIP
jgi:hypothetical protein